MDPATLDDAGTAPLVRLRGVVIGHGRRAIAPAFDLDVRPGDFALLVGPNGAGKTTLVRTILGVAPPLAGTREATVDGRPIRFGYVPQRERLDELWPFSVLDIALLGAVPALRPFEALGRARRRRAREVLARVGIADLADRPFRDLSGGQQQRALIARALLAEPDVLVLDEPTNHLDVPGERAVYELLGRLHREAGRRATVVVAHHLEPALPVANRVWVLEPGKPPRAGEVTATIASGALDGLRVPSFGGGGR